MAHLTATSIPTPARAAPDASRAAKDGFMIFAVALSVLLLAVSLLDRSNKSGSALENDPPAQYSGL